MHSGPPLPSRVANGIPSLVAPTWYNRENDGLPSRLTSSNFMLRKMSSLPNCHSQPIVSRHEPVCLSARLPSGVPRPFHEPIRSLKVCSASRGVRLAGASALGAAEIEPSSRVARAKQVRFMSIPQGTDPSAWCFGAEGRDRLILPINPQGARKLRWLKGVIMHNVRRFRHRQHFEQGLQGLGSHGFSE